jgi:SSS family solute:Na+ symporter
MYTGLIALAMNIVVAVIANLALGKGSQPALKQS